MKFSKLSRWAAGSTVALVLLSGCAGQQADSAPEEEGFEFGADQEVVNELIADFEPVTLRHQPAAASPNNSLAPRAIAFKEAVEERSNGQITIELVWGQAIAGYTELDDALNDGRVDIARNLPLYSPDEYPAFNALTEAMSGYPVTPLVGELVKNASTIETAWASNELLEEYESHGIHPLVPMMTSGTTYSLCTEPGLSLDDWEGRQIRAASTSHHEVSEAIGAVPVSMEYGEMYEALQRGTVDCTLAQLPSATETGILEQAPYVGYMSREAHISAHSGGGIVAGSKYGQLPLAYQQIIFDAANIEGSIVTAETYAMSTAEAIGDAEEYGGSVNQFEATAEDKLIEVNEDQIEAALDGGLVSEEVLNVGADSIERWEQRAEELGIEDSGPLEEANEWLDLEEVDLETFVNEFYMDVVLPHRPN